MTNPTRRSRTTARPFPCFTSALVATIVCTIVNPATASGGQQPPAAITAQNPATIQIPSQGPASVYPLQIVVSGFQGTLASVDVQLNNANHERVSDLDVLLVGPQGQRVILLADVPDPGNLRNYLTDAYPRFSSLGGGPPVFQGAANYIYQTQNWNPATVLPAPAPAGPYTLPLSTFDNLSPNGTWSLYVYDDSPGSGGSLDGFTLHLQPRFDNTQWALVPPSGTAGMTESPLTVSGLTRRLYNFQVGLHIVHPNLGDLDISVISPDGTAIQLTGGAGGTGDNYGTSCEAPTIFTAGTTLALSQRSPPFVDKFAPEQSFAPYFAKAAASLNGTWRLRISDTAAGNTGVLVCWSLRFAEVDAPQAPTSLRATEIVGNRLTMRWAPHVSAFNGVPGASDFVIEGGVHPGETLAQIATGGAPTLTLDAPTGAFHVRTRALIDGQWSPPSNEIKVFVNVPAPPSAPVNLKTAGATSALDMAWTNTFSGGAPTHMALDVAGSATATILLPMSEAATFTGIPDGSYTLQLRAINAAGSSPPTSPFTISFPTVICSNPPQPPIRLLTYRIGQTVYATWERSGDGPAATSFIVYVIGAFNGSFPITARNVSATVGSGNYTISVAAVNLCGGSASTAAQTVTVP